MSKTLAYLPALPTSELAQRQMYGFRSRRGLKLCAAVALLLLLSIWNLDYLKGSIVAGPGQRTELVRVEVGEWIEEATDVEKWTVPLEAHIM
jgi:hypothetical protein